MLGLLWNPGLEPSLQARRGLFELFVHPLLLQTPRRFWRRRTQGTGMGKFTMCTTLTVSWARIALVWGLSAYLNHIQANHGIHVACAASGDKRLDEWVTVDKLSPWTTPRGPVARPDALPSLQLGGSGWVPRHGPSWARAPPCMGQCVAGRPSACLTCAVLCTCCRCRDLLSPTGGLDVKVTRRFKRKFEEYHHVTAVSSSSSSMQQQHAGLGMQGRCRAQLQQQS